MPDAVERFGWVLFEEVVRRALADGLLEVRQQIELNGGDDLLRRIYWSFDSKQIQQVRNWIESHDVPIVDNYPQDPQQMPCWALVLLGEDEQQVVGEQAHRVEFPEGHEGVLSVVLWLTHIGVLSMAESPVIVRWLYQLAKFALSARRRTVFRSDMQYLTWQLSGRDLGFESAFLQAGRFVYQRMLVVSSQYPQYDHIRDPDPGWVSVDLQGHVVQGTVVR